jgi:hypothetical protein
MYGGKPEDEASSQFFSQNVPFTAGLAGLSLSRLFESNTQYASMGSNMIKYIEL